MTKRRIIKMLALVFALAMLLSVTAYAVNWTENGVSCSGYCGYKSATTTAGSPMYIEANVYCEYVDPSGRILNTRNEATNAGVLITATANIPSGSTMLVTEGMHRAGSGPYYPSNYDHGI